MQKVFLAAKNRANQAMAVEEMAGWLIKIILETSPAEFPEHKHLFIGDGTPRGWALYVSAHREEYAGLIEHVRSEGGVLGRLVLRKPLPHGGFGPVAYSLRIAPEGVTFSNGGVVGPYYMDHITTVESVRRQIAIEMLYAIQEALAEI